MGRAGLVVLLVLAAATLAGPETAGPEAVKERVEALRKSGLERLEIHLGGKGALVPAVRIERISEIRTFLSHIVEAAWRRVLVLGEPAPAIARVVVTRQEGAGLELDVTRRSFRLGTGRARPGSSRAPRCCAG